MARRSFRGEAGRPFGTVAVLLCVLLTSAAFVLGRIAFKITGTWVPMEPDPALIPALRDYWGLLLASEIVKAVNAGAATKFGPESFHRCGLERRLAVLDVHREAHGLRAVLRSCH